MDRATSERSQVLFITNCYTRPEEVSVGASMRMFQFVKALVEARWGVNVVTASVSPLMASQGPSIDNGEDGGQKKSPSNPHVERVNVRVLNSNTILARLLHYVDFFLGALKIVLKQKSAPSIIFASMPTILIGALGALGSWRYRVPFILDVRDLWSDSLKATKFAHVPGFIACNWIIERKIYNSADTILVTTENQRKYILENSDCSSERVVLIPNGFDVEYRNAEEVGVTETYLNIYNLKSKYTALAMFAGKHAAYTNLRAVVDAALLEPSIGFVLIGGGYERSDIIRYARARRASNVYFFEPVPKAEILQLLSLAEIFLINYSHSEAWSKVLPNKLFDYLFFNKPIIAAVCDGEISGILENCGGGVVVAPDEPELLAGACRRAANGEILAMHNRDFLMRNYDRRVTLEMFVTTVNGFRE